jgi:hypothetical protein
MRTSIIALVALIAAVTLATREAAATRRCAPLPVQGTGSPTCKCTVQNYSTVPDTAINIVIYDAAGGLHSCNGVTLPPRTATYCHVSVAPGGICGCVVSGEGSLTYASLSVTDLATVGAQASVECQ